MDEVDQTSKSFEEIDNDQVPETDITFLCPHCGKSLSIDYRGAGLIIACTACHKLVTVPIPDGMDIMDLDTDAEQARPQLLALRKALARSESRVHDLEAELATLRKHQSATEHSRARAAHKLAELRTLSEGILKTHMELSGAVSKIIDVLSDNE